MSIRTTLNHSLLSALIALSACSYAADNQWAREALVQKVEQGALIVDVRTPEEYRKGHIKGSINVPHTEVKTRMSEFGADPSRPIVVYCGKGGRAEHARMSLQEEGFTNVWNLGSYSNLAKADPNIVVLE